MKKISLWTKIVMLVAAAFMALPSNANKIEESIILSIEAKHREFIDGENLAIGLRIKNRGDSPFIVDTYGKFKENSVTFYVRNNSGELLFPKKTADEFKQIMVMPRDEQDFIVNLEDIFGRIPQGKYTIHAILINGEARTSSELLNFEIVRGIEILKAKYLREGLISNEFFGYTLLYWVRDGGEQLFLRIDNLRTGGLYDFIQLGNLVRVDKPYIKFLPQNVVEVVHQNSRDNFIKTRISVGSDHAVLLKRDTIVNPEAIKEAETYKRTSDAIKAKEHQQMLESKRRGILN